MATRTKNETHSTSSVRAQKTENKSPKLKKASASKKSTSKKGKSSTSVVKKSARKATTKATKPTPKKAVKKTPAKSMEDLLAKTGYEFNVPQQGAVVEGLVTEVTKKVVLVDIGGKTEGMVVDREYEAAYGLIQGISVGDKIRAIVVSPENDRGQILLSLKREAAQRAWEHYKELMETKEILVVRGLEVNRGGLIVRADGTRGFIPTSQFGKALQGKLDDLIERPVKVKVIEVNREKNRLIFSERHVSEAEVLKKKVTALKLINKGDIFPGTISGIMPFGIFVTVTVPLRQAQGKHSKGKMAKKAEASKSAKEKGKDGEVAEVDGLVHISEISWEKVNDPHDYYKEGDTVKVKVLSIDDDAGKLNLSVKQLLDDPWDEIEREYKPGSKHKGEVTRVEPFGVFVHFEAGVDGLIHISKIPAGEEPEVGKKIDVFVETVDQESRRMSLAMVLKTTEKLIYK